MAVRSRPWPGVAAVEVSLAAIYKGTWKGRRVLDGKQVDFISTYFDDQMTNGNPKPLAANAEKSFQGSIVLGKGFVLEPAEAEALIARNPKNRDVLFPYLNGEDLNSRSDQSPSRWVINFFDWPLNRDTAPEGYTGPVAADYPDCLEIVERLVKPERTEKAASDVAKYPWWQFWRPRNELYRTIAPLERVMVINRHSKIVLFSFLPTTMVYSEATVVLACKNYSSYSIISSNFHDFWAWKNCSTIRSAGLRYSGTEGFETFPFPPGFEPNRDLGVSVPLCEASSPLSHKDATAQREAGTANETRTSFVPPVDTSLRDRLETLGAKLDSDRRELMLKLNIGLTKLYNLYHKPELSLAAIVKEAKCPETDANWAIEKIIALRTLHKTIDETVRDAYRWQDIPLQHGFYELEFLPENDRVRYTVSNTARKLILSELLKLNHTRHAEELAAGLVDENGKILKTNPNGDTKTQKKKTPQKDEGQEELF